MFMNRGFCDRLIFLIHLYSHFQRKSGVKDGARVLREANLLKVLEGTGLRVQDFGDVDLASCHDFDIDQPEDVNLRHPTYIAEASLKVVG